MHDDNTATMYELWTDLIRRRWLIFGIVATLTLLGTAIAFLTRPVYRSEIVMIPAATQGQENLLSSAASGLGGFAAFFPGALSEGSTKKDESIAVLLSRSFTEKFIKRHDLLPVLFPDRWDEELNDWSPDRQVPTMNDAVRRFDNEIRSLDDDPLSGLITLSVEWYDPVLAAEWANRLVEQVNAQVRTSEILEAEESLKYLNAELKKTSIVNLQQVIYGLIQSHINKIMLANVRKEYAFKVIDPAVPPDEDDFVSPRRTLLIAAAMLAGILLSGFVALLLGAVDRARRARSAQTVGTTVDA